MLNKKAVIQSAAVDGPTVGSLFVPSRVAPVSGPSPPNPLKDATVCRIAGVQRTPLSGDFGLGGLLTPQKPQPVVPAPAVPVPAGAKTRLQISWAGSGIYFWWQLGAVHYLLQQFDLTKVPMTGASGGGFAAILAACNVDPLQVIDSAYELSLEHSIWERPLGLMGVWGHIIEEWLHDLLPPDAAEQCRDHVGLVVTELPSCQQVAISDFKDKTDLVTVAMASAHVPLILDWRMARECRGVPCVDGSFPDFFSGVNCDLLTRGGQAIVFDYFEDPKLIRQGRMDMLQLKQYREIKRICMLGYKYAQRMYNEGHFDRFDLDPVKRR